MHNFTAGWTLATLLCLTGVAVQADTVTLTDGRQILGKVVSPEDAAWVEITTDAGTFRYLASMVQSIVKNDKGIPAERPAPTTADAGPGPEIGPLSGAGGTDVSKTGAELDTQKFTQAKAQADQAKAAADGLAVWQRLLAEATRGPAIDQARKELALWQQRVSQDRVKFGPDWQPKSAVGDRLAKADELVVKADAAENADEAVRLLDQASQLNPYRADIPFRKGMRLFKPSRFRQAGMALGEALRIDPNHVAARNNLGVMAAQQKNWAAALAGLGKAATILAASDPANTVVLDNLDLVITLAEQAGQPQANLAAAQNQLAAVVAAMHQAGKAVGRVRWGNTWITQDDYDRRVKKNQDVDRAIADINIRMSNLDTRYKQAQKFLDDTRRRIKELTPSKSSPRRGITGNEELDRLQLRAMDYENDLRTMEGEAKRVREEVETQKAKKDAAPHAAKLALLDEQCAVFDSVDVSGASAPKPKEADKGPAGLKKPDAEPAK